MSSRTIHPIYNEEQNRDLGFGSVVATESRERLLNRDGSFNVARRGLSFRSSLSLYHWFLTIAWWKFLAIVTLVYFMANVAFAFGYVLCGPGALAGAGCGASGCGLAQAFFFSAETISTVGYGHILPVSVAANLLVTLESFVGLLGLALAASLLFARFSRPNARIIFSQSAIIAPYQGITAFEFRIANARSNQIIELAAQVLFSRLEKSDGKSVRRFYPLALERDKVTFFPLSWTIVHPIDETSPLSGLRHEDLRASDAEFLILLSGIDETFSQTVHTRSSYKADEIVWNAKFANVFNRRADNQPITIAIDRLHQVERLETHPNSDFVAAD